jgi:hypothetical protein
MSFQAMETLFLHEIGNKILSSLCVMFSAPKSLKSFLKGEIKELRFVREVVTMIVYSLVCPVNIQYPLDIEYDAKLGGLLTLHNHMMI